jgi:hypothetical protein
MGSIALGAYAASPGRLDGEPELLAFSDETRNEFGRRREPPLAFEIPEDSFKGHVVLAGQSGSGKTETLLRLVYEVSAKCGWQVVVVDAKADSELAGRLAGLAKVAGVRFRGFPQDPYDLWQGAPEDVSTRLMVLRAPLDAAGSARFGNAV